MLHLCSSYKHLRQIRSSTMMTYKMSSPTTEEPRTAAPVALSTRQVRELSIASWCDERTIRRFFRRGVVRVSSATRIVAALRKLRARDPQSWGHPSIVAGSTSDTANRFLGSACIYYTN